MNATFWPEHEGARRRGLPVVKACYPRLVSKLAGVPPIMVLTPPKIHNVGKSYPAVEETSHAVEESFHGFYLTFPDFTRHFLLALSETVDSLLRAILIQ